MFCYMFKNKITKILTLKIQKGKSLIKWQNQKHQKYIKRRDNNSHIPDLVHACTVELHV